MTPSRLTRFLVPCQLVVAVTLTAAVMETAARATPPTSTAGWRHDGTGRYPASGTPVDWDLEARRQLRWRTSLPGWSNSSPVVVDGRVFVTCEPSTLVAVSTGDGALSWQDSVTVVDALPPARAVEARAALRDAREATVKLETVQREHRTLLRLLRKRTSAEDTAIKQARLTAVDAELSNLRMRIARADRFTSRARHDTIGYASATPVSDGAYVYTVYGTGVVAGYTVDGRRHWLRWLGEPHRPMRGNPYGHAASPLLVGGQLVVGLGSLHALDPMTGDVRWRAGIYDDFGSPAAVQVAGQVAVATPKGLVYRARDGALLADVGAGVVYVGPVTDGERVYWVGSTVAADTSAGNDYGTIAMAVRTADLNANGATVEPIWRTSLGRTAIYATPAVEDGILYVVDRRDSLTLLDARTGDTLWSRKLHLGLVSASPVVLDDMVYIFGEDGRAAVVRSGREFELLGTPRTEGGRATPYAAGKRLYMRSSDALWSLGQP